MAEPESRPRTPLFPAQFSLPRVQFSLRWLLLAMTMVAILLGITVIVGDTIVYFLYLAITVCLLPTPLLIGIIFGRGDVRAFSVGAILPWVALWANLTPDLPGHWFMWRAVIMTMFLVFTGMMCGLFAVVSRRLVERLEP